MALNISAWSIRRPLPAVVLSIILLILGWVSFLKLPVTRLPAADIPVVWTNTRYHMLYMNMGHGDQILTSPIQNHLFEDAINWLGTR